MSFQLKRDAKAMQFCPKVIRLRLLLLAKSYVDWSYHDARN
jgi:hypothetical protein